MPLSDLPVDILFLVLCECHDMTDLRHLALASRPLYNVFIRSQTSILEAVFRNAFPSEIQSLAITAMLCRKKREDDSSRPEDNSFVSLLETCNSTVSVLPRPSLDFRDMFRYQDHLDDLAHDLCRHCFAVASSQGYAVSDDEPALSYEESVRIHGAFYLISIFYHLRNEGHSRYDIQEPLLHQFSPWRLDELACVYDFLCLRLAYLSERCSELCMRGPQEYLRCATNTTALPVRGLNHWTEHFFANDLDWCHSAIVRDQSSEPERERFNEICQILDGAIHSSESRGTWLSSALNDKLNTYDDANCVTNNPEHHEGASGPNAAWKWRRRNVRCDWANLEDEDLAAWCSSVWDESRLKRWRVLDQPRDPRAFAFWSAQRSARLDAERYRRLSADEDKPKSIPCNHGVVLPAVPTRNSELWYQTMPGGNFAWSTCRQCYTDRVRSQTYTARVLWFCVGPGSTNP